MIKRTLYFGQPAKLRLQNEQLKVEYDDELKMESKLVPIEDIGIVVLDHYQITFTQGLTLALLQNNAAMLWCDGRHLPAGLVLPFEGNSELTEKLRYQLEASEPLKKNLWKLTIQQKIKNQAAVLKHFNRPYQSLTELAKRTTSGDTENTEAQAAAIYWRTLFDPEKGFRRGRYEDAPNNLLNYGYAILRAVVARSLVGSGMLPALGIHHRNKYNPFCLADDIMEPYRPYVDKLVVEYILKRNEALGEELDKDSKIQMLAIPALDVEIENQKSPLMVAMQRTTSSLMKCFEGEGRRIAYPEI